MGWPAEKALIKLGDLISEGTGGAFAPWQKRRIGKAEVDAKRDEMLMLAQTERDVEEIRTGKMRYTEEHKLIASISKDNTSVINEGQQNGRIEPYLNFESLSKQSENRRKTQAIQEEVNLTKTVLFAEQELESGNYEANDEPVDPDWFTRWRDSAEKVSNDDLQKLWAKALAGEVATPGSYSLRTLEFLKNLTQIEAKQISKLASYVIDGFIFKLPYLETNGLNFAYLLEMEDLGIISGHKGNGLEMTKESLDEERYLQTFQYGGKILLIERDKQQPPLKAHVLKVTKLGQEVLRLGAFPYDYQYFKSIGESIKAKQFSVKLADVTGFSPNQVHYANPQIL